MEPKQPYAPKGSETRVLVKPRGVQVWVALTVDGFTEGADVERTTAGTVVKACKCNVEFGWTEWYNRRVAGDLHVSCGLINRE